MVKAWSHVGRGTTVAGVTALVVTGCGAAVGGGSVGQPHPVGIASCQSADLTASVGEYGSEASQPFLTVKLTNHTAAPCRMKGYSVLTVVGNDADPPARPIHVVVSHGSTYERADPGPHPLLVAPHRFASFTIGTATAYTGPMATLHRFKIRLDTGDHALVVDQEMPANGPRGEPIPVKETALGLGIPKPPR